LNQLNTAILNSLKLVCNCQLDGHSLVSDSLSCSEVVDNSTLYRARLNNVGDRTASSIYDILTHWITYKPSIILNNTHYKIDTDCEILADSPDQSECNGPSDDEDSSKESNNIILYAAIGGSVVFLLIVIILLFIICKKKQSCNSPYKLSRAIG